MSNSIKRAAAGPCRDINVRVTDDERFWGAKYDASMFLWRLSLYRRSLQDIVEAPALEDPFPSSQANQEAHDACRAYYYRYLDELSQKFNAMHGVDYPAMFWRIAFGSWLYRHISIAYDKFMTLRQVDVDRTSVVLLSPTSFFVPNDHYEYMLNYCSDFGALQLVSQYYAAFASVEMDTAEATFDGDKERHAWGNHHNHVILRGVNDGVARFSSGSQNHNAQVALCSAYYPEHVIRELLERSGGRMIDLMLPPVVVQGERFDQAMRQSLTETESDDPFDVFLCKTLRYGTPKIFVEYFAEYHQAYVDHLQANPLKAIVTECWDSFAPTTIYCAIAKYRAGTQLVLQQHGASLQWLYCNLQWLEVEVADTFLTTGFHLDHPCAVAGGFITREQPGYTFSAEKTDIVHASTTRFPYHVTWATGLGGVRLVRYLCTVDALLASLPPTLRPHYVLRARREYMLLDTERLWQVGARGVRVDSGQDFLSLLLQARIVVIDHVSTGFAEILANRIPFVFLFIPGFHEFPAEYAHLFDELFACGVAHDSPQALIRHLEAVYDDVQGWWMGEGVQRAVSALADPTLKPARTAVEHLLSIAAQTGATSGGARKSSGA